MAQSFQMRLEGRELEVWQDVQARGWLAPMDDYGARDTIAWKRFVAYLADRFHGKIPPAATTLATKTYEEFCADIVAKIMSDNESAKTKIAELSQELATLRNVIRAREDSKRSMAYKMIQRLELGGLEGGSDR